MQIVFAKSPGPSFNALTLILTLYVSTVKWLIKFHTALVECGAVWSHAIVPYRDNRSLTIHSFTRSLSFFFFLRQYYPLTCKSDCLCLSLNIESR